MQQAAVERSIWIAAPRERVWQAVTDPEQIARWLLPPALGAELKRDDRDTLLVCMGPMEAPIAQLEAPDPPRQVTMRSLPDQLVAATLALGEANSGTQVTVTLTGLGSLLGDAGQDRLGPATAGWEKTLQNLSAAVAGSELPFPQGYVATLFGYRRETTETYAVERSIWIAAPRERVWQAIIDPAQYEQWFSPGTAWQLTALERGGRLFVLDPATGAEQFTQIIEQIEPPERLVLQTPPQPSGSFEVTTYTLREERGGARLTVTNAGYALLAEDARWNAMEQNAFGFGMMLANVKAFIEGRPLPYPGGF